MVLFLLQSFFAAFSTFSFWRRFSIRLRLVSSSDKSLSDVDAERAGSNSECADESLCISFSCMKQMQQLHLPPRIGLGSWYLVHPLGSAPRWLLIFPSWCTWWMQRRGWRRIFMRSRRSTWRGKTRVHSPLGWPPWYWRGSLGQCVVCWLRLQTCPFWRHWRRAFCSWRLPSFWSQRGGWELWWVGPGRRLLLGGLIRWLQQ